MLCYLLILLMCGVLREFREVENSRGMTARTTMRNWKSLPFFAFDSPFSFDARCGLFLFFTTDGRNISLFPLLYTTPFFTLSFLFLVSISPRFLHSLGPMLPIYSKLPKPFLLFSTIPHLSNFSPHPTSPTSPHFFYFRFPILSCFKPFSRITPPPDTCHLLLQVSAQCPGT